MVSRTCGDRIRHCLEPTTEDTYTNSLKFNTSNVWRYGANHNLMPLWGHRNFFTPIAVIPLSVLNTFTVRVQLVTVLLDIDNNILINLHRLIDRCQTIVVKERFLILLRLLLFKSHGLFRRRRWLIKVARLRIKQASVKIF